MIEPMLGELAESLRVHDRTVKLIFYSRFLKAI
jgi:hypothetical protein